MKEFEAALLERAAESEKRERAFLAERMQGVRTSHAEREKRARAQIAAIGAVLMTLCLLTGGLLAGGNAAAKVGRAERHAAEAEEREQRLMEQIESMRAELLKDEAEKPDTELTTDTSIYDRPAWEYAGLFRIVHYCPCEKCCGKTDGITRTGTKATEGRTVSVDPDVIPLGSEIRVGDNIYVAEDTGVSGNTIDIFVNDHEEALRLGTYTAGVWWR